MCPHVNVVSASLLLHIWFPQADTKQVRIRAQFETKQRKTKTSNSGIRTMMKAGG